MLTDIFIFIGGIGLFLLGMRQMTDGLKVAAGNTLRNILTAATRNPLRGLASGLLITTAVQSSSAVIFATIGFVNVGLLTLYQAIGIVYGSNLGTTLTSWVVALIGFNVNLRALAMPAIGVGMAVWVMFGASRRGAIGQAIAGFGLFFLGIDVLRDSFEHFGDAMALDAWLDAGLLGIAVFLLAGILLTVLMQSSSAALAVTLTAAAGGIVPVDAAAAMIIGANVGTTSTAIFAAIGATSPARRVAAAHVLFNIVTATLALAGLPLLLWLAQSLNGLFAGEPHVAVTLAMFHTMTKLLGIAVMWPATARLVNILERRFRSAEEDDARPQHLDRTTLVTPALALDALGLELHRMSQIARNLCAEALSNERSNLTALERGHATLESLQSAIGEFTTSIHRQGKNPELVNTLPSALRVAQYLVNLGELAPELAREAPEAHIDTPELAEQLAHLRAAAAALLTATRVDREDWDAAELQETEKQFQVLYQTVKARLLRAGTSGEITPRRMAKVLEHCSLLRRICDQTVKSALHLDRFLKEHHREPVQDSGDDVDKSMGQPSG